MSHSRVGRRVSDYEAHVIDIQERRAEREMLNDAVSDVGTTVALVVIVGLTWRLATRLRRREAQLPGAPRRA